MSEIARRRPPPEWIVTAGGKRRHLSGRWSMERVAEELNTVRHKWHLLDDLARLVYGCTSKKHRDNARKHIPAQRNYMLARLTPFVTRYGPRGTIEAIKAFEPDEPDDVQNLQIELQRLRDRKEITEEKYNHMCELLMLPPIHPEPDAS
jgi:hypothetical protein